MTVSTTLNKITYQGNNTATAFSFPFAMPGGLTPTQGSAFLVVTYINTSGVSSTIVFGSGNQQYQLSLNAPISPNPTGIGGIVTFAPGGSPIPVGSTITIQRILPATQLTSLPPQSTLWQTVIEQALDYITMLDQQIGALTAAVIQAPATDPAGLNYVLPNVAARALQFFAFDGSGNVIAASSPGVVPISSAMQPVVSATTLALARTALGLGAMAVEGIGAGLQDDGAGNARVMFTINKLNLSATLTSANYLQRIKATGPITLTMNRANTYFAGFGFFLEVLPQSTGPVTMAINASDQIENGASGAGTTFRPGTSVLISTDAAST